ncbi:isochorismate synthase [bacterium]|nr:isochorismate synthase [bacterium]
MTVGELVTRRLRAAPDLPAALSALAAALDDAPAAVAGDVTRIEVPLNTGVAALDLPAGLPAGVLEPRMLLGSTWSGAGAALEREVAGPAELTAPPPPLRGAVTVRFDPARTPDAAWEPFGRCRMWVPALELDTGRDVIAINLGDGVDRDALRRALTDWRRPTAADGHAPLPVSWTADPGDHDTWCDAVEAALARIAGPDGRVPLEKIVLARRIDGRLDRDVDPARLLRAGAPGSTGWPWWIERDGQAWLGETPELLGEREGRHLRTVALAGTRPRGGTPAEDARLADDLLASDKDRREQLAVATWLGRQLASLGAVEPTAGPRELRRLPSLQHLGSDHEVAVPGALADATWIDALHPTPALCGAPRAEVRRWLREVEPFDRGLYGGVVGWLAHDRSVLHVAIRGLQLRGRRISIYAGAGLVRGSDPRREWQETAAKVAAVCHRLGLAAQEVAS